MVEAWNRKKRKRGKKGRPKMSADGGGASELRGHSGQESRSRERESARSRLAIGVKQRHEGESRRDVPSDCPSVIALQVGKRSGGPSTPAKDLGVRL